MDRAMTTPTGRRHHRMLAAATAVAAILTVPACTIRDDIKREVSESMRGLATTKALDVTWVERDGVVVFPADGADLDGSARLALIAYVDSLSPRAGHRVAIPATDGTSGNLATRRVAAVEQALIAFGLAPVRVPDLAPRDDSVPVKSGTWRITPPACPDWSKEPGTDFENLPTSNFGCATVTNLGLMIADPADLVRGRDPGPADGTVAAGAVERYRKGEVKELPDEEKSGLSATVKFE